MSALFAEFAFCEQLSVGVAYLPPVSGHGFFMSILLLSLCCIVLGPDHRAFTDTSHILDLAIGLALFQ